MVLAEGERHRIGIGSFTLDMSDIDSEGLK